MKTIQIVKEDLNGQAKDSMWQALLQYCRMLDQYANINYITQQIW